METIEFIKKVLECLRDMDDAFEVIYTLDVQSVLDKMIESEEIENAMWKSLLPKWNGWESREIVL